MNTVTQMKLDAFAAQNPNTYVQKGLMLRRWRNQIAFNGDLPKTIIKKFAAKREIETEWTSNETATIYFNDLLMRDFVESVAEGTRFIRVATEKEVLAKDGDWKDHFAYRLLFPFRIRPLSADLENKGLEGTPLLRRLGTSVLPDGSEITRSEVVAYLTNSDETSVWLKMNFPSVEIEQR